MATGRRTPIAGGDARPGERAGDPAPAPGPCAVSGCTCARLRKATRRVTQFYDQRLQPSGLRITQFSLLAALRRCGPLPISTLAEEMVMDRTTLTRNLKPLEDAGHLSIAAGPDRRMRVVALTEAGAAAFAAAQPLWREAQRDLVRVLGEDSVTALHGLLDCALAALGSEAQPS